MNPAIVQEILPPLPESPILVIPPLVLPEAEKVVKEVEKVVVQVVDEVKEVLEKVIDVDTLEIRAVETIKRISVKEVLFKCCLR